MRVRAEQVAALRGRREDHGDFGALQRVAEIPDEIVDVFEPDGEPNRFGLDARLAQLVVGELRVRRRSGMDDEALCVADVGEVAPEFERVDEAPPGLAPAAQAEGEDRSELRLAHPSDFRARV